MEKTLNCHGGAREASNLWTAAVLSLSALISREYAQLVKYLQYINDIHVQSFLDIILSGKYRDSFLSTSSPVAKARRDCLETEIC